MRPAGRGWLRRPPSDRRQLPGGSRYPRHGAACRHRATARGVRALPGAVREVARNPDRQRSITGGKRMTIHEEQPVTAEPRIDDENTADAGHDPEPATDDIGAEAVREPEPVADADAVEAEPPRGDHESSTAEML